MDPPEGCPPKVARLMTLAWTIDVTQRPSFARMLSLLQAMEDEMTGACPVRTCYHCQSTDRTANLQTLGTCRWRRRVPHRPCP